MATSIDSLLSRSPAVCGRIVIINLYNFDGFIDNEPISREINFIFHHLPESPQFLVISVRINSDFLDQLVQILVIVAQVLRSLNFAVTKNTGR
jgi:hypothetical protein